MPFPSQNRIDKVLQTTTITASTSETTILTANATNRQDIYGLIIANTSGTAASVTIKDSTGGTTRMTISVPAGETRGFMLAVADALPQQSAANNNWTATSSASVSSLVITVLAIKV